MNLLGFIGQLPVVARNGGRGHGSFGQRARIPLSRLLTVSVQAAYTLGMTTTPATDKQIDYLLALANKKYGTRASHLSQLRRELNLSSSKCSRGLSKSEASAFITELKG